MDGSKNGTSFLCQKIVCRKVLFEENVCRGALKLKCLQRKIFALGGNKATGLKGLSIKIELGQSVNILHICENKITKVKCKVM